MYMLQITKVIYLHLCKQLRSCCQGYQIEYFIRCSSNSTSVKQRLHFITKKAANSQINTDSYITFKQT